VSSPDLAPVTRRDGSPTLPRRGYTWPPFAEGNLVASTHGGRSERRFLPLAEKIAGALLDQLDDVTLADQLDAYAWATTEAKRQLVDEWLDEDGQLDEKHDPRAAAEYAIRLARLGKEQKASLFRRRAERQSRTVDGSSGLETQIAEGRRLRVAADARLSRDTAAAAVAEEAGT
jgi:hypothetical protein